MTRGKGYRADPAGHRKTPFGRMLAMRGLDAGAFVPTTFLDLLDAGPPVMDQGSGDFATGACVGHATGRALAIRFKVTADTVTWIPSPAGIYKVARRLDLVLDQRLEDGGCEPNQAVRGIGEWGIGPMRAPTSDGRFSDCEPATINADPVLADLEVDARTLALGAYAITSTGTQREQEIKLALFKGFPICAAVDASDNSPIQNYVAGDSAIADMGANLDHFVCFDAYRGREGSPLELHFTNSWGPNWGENGGCWLGRPAIQQLGDIYVFDVRKVVSP